VGRVTISGLNARDVYRSAFSVEGWSDSPITNVVIRNATVEFKGGGKAEQARQMVKGPGVDARPLPAWGLYARNVERLTIEDCRFGLAEDDFRPVVFAEGVQQLSLDNFRYPIVAGVTEPFATTNVGRVRLLGGTLPSEGTAKQ
jgi:hypothetical protein